EGLRVVVRLTELAAVAKGLVEVVSSQLVNFDELGAMLLEPVRESFVQLRALGLRQGVVRRVAHEEMPETKRVVAGEERPVGTDELLPDESGQLTRDPLTFGHERLDDTVVEDLPFHGATLQHGSL